MGSFWMKAIVYYEYGSTDVVQLRDIEAPGVREGTVLVNVLAAAANPYDYPQRQTRPQFRRF